MGTRTELQKLEEAAAGFGLIYESVRRLAMFHKVSENCREIALLAIVEHPGNVAAAAKAAPRCSLNAARRQRLPARPIDDRIDGIEDSMEVDTDTRSLPEGIEPSRLNENGEWEDKNEDQKDQDQASDLIPDEALHVSCAWLTSLPPSSHRLF